MIIYDLLSFDKGRTWDKSKRLPRHKTYSSKKVLQLEPNVKKEGLTGASVYYDCMSIFPERLTLAFIKSAVKCGAQASNYSMVTGFIKNNSTISGVCVKDLLNNKTVEIKGKLVINCGGPWADIILGIANENKTGKEIRRSEGIHIITKKIVNNHSVTCLTPEGRHLFLCPWRGHTLIGTTDREYIGSPDEFRVTKNRIMELLDDLNEVFGNNDSEKIKYNDIVHTYGGLRPLVEDQTEDLYNSSRKYEIYDNSKDGLEGLVTVEGGKYTTSRNLAEHVVSLVFKKLKMKSTKCITAKKHLAGSEINDMEKFVEKIIHENSDFEQSTLEYLARNYGTEYKSVLDIARKDKALCEIMNADGEIMAQVAYGIRNEMAKKLTDIIFRRTGIGTLGHPGGNLNKAADLAAKELNWSKSRLEQEIGEANNRLALPE